jgi:hypothetical protein
MLVISAVIILTRRLALTSAEDVVREELSQQSAFVTQAPEEILEVRSCAERSGKNLGYKMGYTGRGLRYDM